jgi:hypothetical protein
VAVNGIWVGILEHKHGTNAYASTTIEGLEKQLYNYVAFWWELEIDEPLPDKDVPKRVVIDYYFNHLEGRESYVIHNVGLLDEEDEK